MYFFEDESDEKFKVDRTDTSVWEKNELRQKAFNFNAIRESLTAALFLQTCATLQKISRLLSIKQNVRKLKKTDACDLIVSILEAQPFLVIDEHAADATTVIKRRTIYDISAYEKGCTSAIKGSGWVSYTSGEKIVCQLLDAFMEQERRANLKAAKKTCGTKTISGKKYETKLPAYGRNGTSDCEAGYMQPYPNACCFKVEDLVGMDEKEVEGMLRSDAFNLFTDLEKEEIRKSMIADVESVRSQLDNMKSEPPAQRALTKTVINALQRRTMAALTSRFQEILENDIESEADPDLLCENEAWIPDWVKRSAYFAAASLKSVILFLWWIIKKLTSWTLQAVGKVIGGVTYTLRSISEKLAGWMVMSPKSALLFLTCAKQMRRTLCSNIGATVVDYGVSYGIFQKIQPPSPGSTIKNLGQLLVEGGGRVGEVIMDSGVLTTIAGNLVTKLAAPDNLKKIMGGFASSLFQSIPGIGGVVAVVTEIAGQTLGDAIVKVTEDVVYARDVAESFRLLMEVLDVGECIRYMPRVKCLCPALIAWINYFEDKKAEILGGPNKLRAVQNARAEKERNDAVVSNELLKISTLPTVQPPEETQQANAIRVAEGIVLESDRGLF